MKIRFGLTAMLGLVLLLGLPLALLRRELDRRAGHVAALRDLQRRGAMLTGNLSIPRHPVFRWFEDEFDIERIYQISLYRSDVGDDDLPILQQLPNVGYVRVRHSNNITDAGLMHFAKLRTLTNITITSSVITDDGVRRFRRVRPDVRVYFFPDRPPERMTAIQKQRGVAFGYTTGQLVSASLYGDQLGDDDVRHYFGSDSLTGGLDKLTEMWIGNTKVTDVGLLHLEKLPALKRLSISDSPVTREGIEHYKLVRPDVEVILFLSNEDGTVRTVRLD